MFLLPSFLRNKETKEGRPRSKSRSRRFSPSSEKLLAKYTSKSSKVLTKMAKLSASSRPKRKSKGQRMRQRRRLKEKDERVNASHLKLRLGHLSFSLGDDDNGRACWAVDEDDSENELDPHDLESENIVLEAKNNMIRLKNELLLHSIQEKRQEMAEMVAEVEYLRAQLHPSIHFPSRFRLPPKKDH